MDDRQIHRMFEIGVWLKGTHALIECGSGLLLAFVSNAAILHIVGIATQHELIGGPKDAITLLLLRWANGLSVATQHFYAFYLLSHGLVKVFLVVGLLRGKLWSYPASLMVLGLFIAYQLYRFSYTSGVGLIILSVFDLVVMMLIWREYALVRHMGVNPSSPSSR